MNKQDFHLPSWLVFGVPQCLKNHNKYKYCISSSSVRLAIRLQNTGNVIRISTNPEESNPTFIQGVLLEAVLKNIGDIFNYPAWKTQKTILSWIGIEDSLFYSSESQGQLANDLLIERVMILR